MKWCSPVRSHDDIMLTGWSAEDRFLSQAERRSFTSVTILTCHASLAVVRRDSVHVDLELTAVRLPDFRGLEGL